MKPWWRSTIRVRLTLLYAGAFFLAGAILVAVLYLYLGLSLDHQLSGRVASSGQLRSHEVPPALADQLQTQLRQGRDETLRAMLVASLVALGVTGVAAAGFGWLLAGRALRPLQDITATARRVADRSLHERIALDGPDDEVKDLADTFDAMLERLDRAFDSQRRFVANASHELRTPLTINRTLIEVALDNPQASEPLRQLGANLLAVNQRHERLIDDLLTLASSEQRLTDPNPVDLADIARHVTSEAQAAAQQAGIELRPGLVSAPVAGDPALLERLVQNLIDNAIRYNLADHGWVAVTSGLDAATAQLTVENPGPLVPTYELPSLFEPFRRLATTERRSHQRQSWGRTGPVHRSLCGPCPRRRSPRHTPPGRRAHRPRAHPSPHHGQPDQRPGANSHTHVRGIGTRQHGRRNPARMTMFWRPANPVPPGTAIFTTAVPSPWQ